MASPDNDLEQARLHFKSGRLADADWFARRALERDSDNADALNIAGMCAANTGKIDEAIALLSRVVAIKPTYVRARANLAMLLLDRRELAAAELHARLAVESAPQLAVAHFALGRTLRAVNRFEEAITALSRTLELDPNHAEALYELALANDASQHFDQTEANLARLIQLRPTELRAYSALAAVQLHQGLADAALATYRAGQAATSTDAAFASYLLLVGMYHADITAQQLFDETAKWNAKFAAPLASEIQPHANLRDPDRQLRIGYISPNFREHSVAFFFESILAAHDRSRFRVFLYHDSALSDAVTARLQSHGDVWRDIAGKDDRAVANLIRDDQIDILVDLAQHLQGNRMLVFARKPAPVQVSYLGYPATTGLTTIDYRLSDSYLDPPDAPPVPGSERIIRLPESYFCYRPPDVAPEIVVPPVLRNGFITFASQHSLLKLNDASLTTWADLLRHVPRSRLMIKALGCASESARARIRKMFESANVDGDRLTFLGFSPLHQAMQELNDADIALDSFPYSGGTTTCHTLWMGVPVISLAGELPFHRMGLSVLAQIGLADLAGKTCEEYVQIAINLAGDVDRLRELRATLRDRMKDSPLMQADRFDRNLEKIYREIWQNFCAKKE